MKRVARKLNSLLKTLPVINRLELDETLKKKIRTTWFKVFFFKCYDAKNKIADILGYKIKYIDLWMLKLIFNEIFLYEEYYFLAENDHPVIIDCGSNIGMSILYFKTLYPESRIVAFEPGREAYMCLEKNIKDNHLSSVSLHNCALSDKEGEIDLYYDPSNLGALCMSIKPQRLYKEKVKVKTELLSKYINEDVDFLKMDIEGAELEVITELAKAKKLKSIKQMIIEYHHHFIKDRDAFSGILRILEDAGFGYQLGSELKKPFKAEEFQDIIIYAYRKQSLNK
jgi:FkbM family methyltransferase